MHAIGKNALGNRALLEDVVQHKKVFFHAGHASYDACLRGALQLIPGKVELAALQTDFEKMVGAGMFFLAPPSFAEIVDRLRRVETEINAATRDCGDRDDLTFGVRRLAAAVFVLGASPRTPNHSNHSILFTVYRDL